MPYTNAISAATNGTTLFVAGTESFYTFNAATNEVSGYSKVEGMADVGMAYIGYDATTGFAILAYKNGNIDLFKNETFYNIPDIKLKSITGVKSINHIFTEDGLAYLSTSFGIVVLNLDKKETKETYSFITNNQTIAVRELTIAGNFIYALTPKGIYKANKNNPNLQAFSSWLKIDSVTNLQNIVTSHGSIYVNTADTVFKLDNDTLSFVYASGYKISSIDSSKSGIWINQSIPQIDGGSIRLLSTANAIIDTATFSAVPATTLELSDGSVYIADKRKGLCKRTTGNNLEYHKPQGPAAPGAFDILPFNGEFWIAHGGYDENWTYLYFNANLSHYKEGTWKSYSRPDFELFRNEEVTDMVVLAKDPVNGSIYAGSYRSGLFVYKTDGSYEYYRENTNFLEGTHLDEKTYRVAGLSFDLNGNLWLNNCGAEHEVAVKTPEGNWYKYKGAGTNMYSAYVTADDYNQKWYILPSGGAGVVCYNDNSTPENPNDDFSARISTSSINGYVHCIAKDKQGSIWFGTNDGIGILNCSPDQVASGNCQIERPIVQYDQFAGYLFQSEKVKTIAVDGANRKWVGTTNGVWLISPDGDKIVSRFTSENSPLPSNIIQKIAVDPVTGDVYFGTSLGIVTYRGTATEGGTGSSDVVTFPNPVPAGYQGTIAIRGVSENADVRITDVSGQLVYRTKALGGQAIWSGLDYKGRRPQSGVYLIFVTNKDGSATHVGKMVLMN
jgi:hypothetical protein